MPQCCWDLNYQIMLWDVYVGFLEKDSLTQLKYSCADISDKEKSIVFYLAGYVFFYFF